MQIFGDEAVDPLVRTRMIDAKVRFARMPLQWRWIEPVNQVPPTYLWSGADQAVRGLQAGGMVPLAVLYTRPNWASSDGCGPIDLVPIVRYQQYLTALVERYDGDGIDDAPGRPVIRHWEVENEQDFDANPLNNGGQPNHGSCFGGARAAAYADHLRASWQAIKSADPTAVVIFGGVAYERFYNKVGYNPPGPFDYNFVGNALAASQAAHGAEPGWPFFDWMAVHIYNDFRNNWDGAQPYRQELSAKMEHLRQNQMHRPGKFDLRSRPIAITEVGLSSAPADAWTERSEALQAIYPGQVLARAMAEGAPAVLWFVGKDRSIGDCNNIYDWQTFGLIRSKAVDIASDACPTNPLPGYFVGVDSEPKPAHAAFRTAQASLGALNYELALGTAVTGSPEIEAYRFRHPDTGAATVVAFTDNGERIGRRGFPGVLRNMTFDATVIPGWTNSLAVTDHLGDTTIHDGTAIVLPVGQAPIYVRPN